jgi:hypothetical protein
MKLAHRVQKLERLDALTRPNSPLERFQRAFNEAAFRLTGRTDDRIPLESAAFHAVLEDLRPFVEKLSSADLASLITEYERIVLGSVAEVRTG